jgi:hypothetical protein
MSPKPDGRGRLAELSQGHTRLRVEAGVGFSTHSGWAVAVTAGIDDAGHLR